MDGKDEVERFLEANAAWEELVELKKGLQFVSPKDQELVDQFLDRINTLNKKIPNPIKNKIE